MLVAILMATAILLVVLELVRKRKLREEYGFLWISTAVLLMVLALWTDVLEWLKGILGAETQASTLFFGAILFLMLVALQFSVRLTKLTLRNKALGQEVSLLKKEIQDLRNEIDDERDRETPDPETQSAEKVGSKRRPSRE